MIAQWLSNRRVRNFASFCIAAWSSTSVWRLPFKSACTSPAPAAAVLRHLTRDACRRRSDLEHRRGDGLTGLVGALAIEHTISFSAGRMLSI
jgi:hypothetical protein